MTKGQCLCGAVTFTVSKISGRATACHCSQCRRQSGHIWAAAAANIADIEITGLVKWYEASKLAKRGFCPNCGSVLFWKAHDEDAISFALGALDAPTGLKLESHIFVADKGDYYQIGDGLPQHSHS